LLNLACFLAYIDDSEGEIMTDNFNDSLVSLRIKITAARIALNQAWEKYGETNELVLAAGDDFDRLMNEYGRLTNRNRGDII
jgi:hypothetical protein